MGDAKTASLSSDVSCQAGAGRALQRVLGAEDSWQHSVPPREGRLQSCWIRQNQFLRKRLLSWEESELGAREGPGEAQGSQRYTTQAPWRRSPWVTLLCWGMAPRLRRGWVLGHPHQTFSIHCCWSGRSREICDSGKPAFCFLVKCSAINCYSSTEMQQCWSLPIPCSSFRIDQRGYI